MRYTIKNLIDTDIDTFWNKLFFDPDFNRALFVDYLKFNHYEVVEERKDPDGVIHRKIECTPNVQLPAAAKKIFGETVGYTEVGRYEPSQRKYFVDVFTKAGGDRIKTKSEIWCEPHGDKRIERLALVDNTVKVFGLGTILEGYIEQQTRELYAKAAEFTSRYVRERGL